MTPEPSSAPYWFLLFGPVALAIIAAGIAAVCAACRDSYGAVRKDKEQSR